MAPETSALVTKSSRSAVQQINPSQTLRAVTALSRKIQSDQASRKSSASKTDLLADAEEDEAGEDVPVWLVLGTKKHIVDKKRLKPGKIVLPHPYLDTTSPNLRICLITTDPQRMYKDLVADQTFPLDLAKRIGRVIGLQKLKAKYSSFESRRQLCNEYDVFLADDRIITYLPGLLGKVFYKTGAKRPVPVSFEGKKQNFDEHGNKRRKLSEGGTKVVKSELKPTDMAREIERALSSALVHLAPSTSTAVKVGKSGMEPEQIQENVEAVTQTLVEKYVPQKWRNVKSIHIKGPETAALPVWLAEELWEDENDVLEEPLPAKESKKNKKRSGNALADGVALKGEMPEFIEVPGGDGKMRRLERPNAKGTSANGSESLLKATKKRKNDVREENDSKAVERAEKAARKEALRRQKAVAKGTINGVTEASGAEGGGNDGVMKTRGTRMRAVDLI